MYRIFRTRHSNYFQVTVNQLASEKVVNMVTTFSDKDRDGFQPIRKTTLEIVIATKMERKKVTDTVGTFLNQGEDCIKKLRKTGNKPVITTKMERKRLPIWWEPF